jgi:putative DNA primase/helicase
VLFRCFADCKTENVLAAAGLNWQDVLPPRDVPLRRKNDIRKPSPLAAPRTSPTITRYEIRDIKGYLLAYHVREDVPGKDKVYWWEQPDGTPNLGGKKLKNFPLYRIDKLAEANPTSPIFIVEGEKACDVLRAHGYAAVASITGASGTPGDAALRPLIGRQIYLWPDADEVGRRHMQRIGESFARLGARTVSVIEWAGAPEHGDAADLLTMEAATDELQALLDDARPFTVEVETVEPAVAGTLENFRATDLWNARLFVHLHGDGVRYCEKLGGWHVFNGKRWARSEAGEAERLAKETVRQMYEMAAVEPNDARRLEMVKHAAKSESAGKLSAMLELASTEEGIAVPPEAFDADPWKFNVENGTLDLRTGELLPHRPADMLTNLSPAEFRGLDAPAPLFEQLLPDWMAGDQAKVDFLRRAAGYSLSGDMREQVFLFLFGPEAAGKGTFVRAIADVMASYARPTEIATFLTARRDNVRNDIAALVGARLVTASEPEDGQLLDEGLVKILTGQDRTSTRFMFREFFEFAATFKIWLQGNHRPAIKSTGGALWRRLLVVPFTKTVPEEKRDKTLGDKLKTPEERAGIIAWLLRGCLEWQRTGLQPPDSVKAAVKEYRAAEDRLAPFLEECAGASERGQVPAGKLYTAYLLNANTS